jgi:GDPmannose 4,6-dehydratase
MTAATTRPATGKTALVTGITGQDGSYLTELLLAKGYTVHGIVRHASSVLANTSRLDAVYQDPHEAGRRLFLHKGDMTDAGMLVNLIRDVRPDEIYNLAAQSHVRVSFDLPEYTANVTALGVIRLLEAVRASGIDTRIYQASTSEMFGTAAPPQDETTPFHPRSPYGVAKVYAHWATVNYRESYGMFAVSGICFNHESPRRGETFVTRKITRAVARIEAGLEQKVFLGNLDAVRDWGYAPEYVEAMWRMLQADEPVDYVLATGRPATVRDFAQAAFGHAGLDWRDHIEHDPRYERPAEVPELIGNPAKIEREIGWKAEVHWDELARIMVDADRKAL